MKAEKELTERIQIHKPLSEEQKAQLFLQIIEARSVIHSIQDDLDQRVEELKDFKKEAEARMSEQDAIIDSACQNYRQGYLPENVDCVVKYNGNIATFYDVKTGEKVDERPLSDEEQLRLARNRVDAEDIIKEFSKDE
jgi:hypothetical protein